MTDMTKDQLTLTLTNMYGNGNVRIIMNEVRARYYRGRKGIGAWRGNSHWWYIDTSNTKHHS